MRSYILLEREVGDTIFNPPNPAGRPNSLRSMSFRGACPVSVGTCGMKLVRMVSFKGSNK